VREPPEHRQQAVDGGEGVDHVGLRDVAPGLGDEEGPADLGRAARRDPKQVRAMTNDTTVRGRILDLARQYIDLRKDMKPSDERTRRMEVLVTQMRTLAFTAYPLLTELTQSVPQDEGKDARAGERLAAVALLQAMPNTDYIEWLARRLADERPFLGYHAAVALLAAVRSLGGDSRLRERLAKAIQHAVSTIAHVPQDTDRKRILGYAVQELTEAGRHGHRTA
jgi:hypothetical protein